MSQRLSVLVLALGLGLLVASSSLAKPKKTTTSPFATHISTLRSINASLAQADHDYKGHRVAAMKKVHAAVAALRNGVKGTKKSGSGVKSGSGGLSQEQSDAILKQAMQQLNTLQSQLASSTDTRATTAAAHLKLAASELQTALNIK
jgi:hypothetical protein